jgi:hypothetical protein
MKLMEEVPACYALAIADFMLGRREDARMSPLHPLVFPVANTRLCEPRRRQSDLKLAI